MKRIPTRDEVRKEDTWATEDIFPSDEAWEEAFAKAAEYPQQIAAYKGKISHSSDSHRSSSVRTSPWSRQHCS